MGNTLIDEPLPPTQNEPAAGDRPTVDDVPPQAAPGQRRGASPTLIDGPPQAAPGQRRGASPTLPDGPPQRIPTPALAPLYVSPVQAAPITPAPVAPTPVQAPLFASPAPVQAPAQPAAPMPVAVQQPAPMPATAQMQAPPQHPAPVPAAAQMPATAPVQASPQPAAPMPAASPVAPPPAGPLLAGAAAVPPSAPPGALPMPPAPAQNAAGGAPPPFGYPKPGAGAGFLAQLPSMPPARAALPAGTARAGDMAPPEEDASRAAVPPPAPLDAPAAQGSPTQAPFTPGAPAQAPSAQPSQPQAPEGPHAAPRLAPGARTLVGVAPGSPPQAGAHIQYAAQAQPQQGAAPQAPAGPPGAQPLPGAPPHNGPPQDASPQEGSPQEGSPHEDAASPEDAAQDAAPAQQAPQKSRARAAIALIFAVLGVLGIAAVVLGYFFLVRYTPLAARHIPAASNVAVRADVREVGTFEPVRKHVISALQGRPSASGGKTLADRVTETTGIHPAVDIREIIVASVDGKSWVALVGGNFKPGKFVPGMEKALHDDGRTDWRRTGDLLVGPTGIALGQADDGTLVIGTESEIVTASLPSSEEYKRMDLPKDGALSFAVSKEAFEELSRDTGAFDPGGALRRTGHLKGTLALGSDPSVSIDLEPKGGENADALGKDIETFLGRLRLALVLLPDQMGEKTALSAAKVTVENGEVMIRGPWPLEGLDRGCQKLATVLGVK